jgi:uncharacterized repeat protein (TIGR02543 family)
MRKLFFCIVASVLFISVTAYGAESIYMWNLEFDTKGTITKVGTDYSTTYGICSLYDDGTFDVYEDDYGTSRHYTGTYQIIGGKTKKIIFTLDQQGRSEIETMLTDWVQDVADEEGVEISDISFAIKQIKITKATINKKTDTPKNITITIKGTVSAILEGSYATRKFQLTEKILFFPRYVAALNVSQSGSGTVTSNPAGINCGADCTENYACGTSVTLTAAPASGWNFSGWGGDCSGTSPTCTIIMNAAKSVTATFTQTSPTTCTSFTYSDWSACVNGQQTRTVTSSSPTGCTGGNPVLTQSCASLTCNEVWGTGSYGLSWAPGHSLSFYAENHWANTSMTCKLTFSVLFDNGTPGWCSGSIRAHVLAVTNPYSGGAITGYDLGTYPVNTEGAAQCQYTNQLIDGQTDTETEEPADCITPPVGSYCSVALLEEYAPARCGSSDGYCQVDWVQFPDVFSLQ